MQLKSGKDLRNWRKSNKMTQQELADKIGYKVTTLSHYEYEDKQLSKKLIKKVTELNAILHPVPVIDAISEQWNSIKHYKSIYADEMKVIENAIVDLLSLNINKMGIEKTGAYLEFLGKALTALNKIKEYQTTDIDTTKENNKKILSSVLKEANIYLMK